MKYALWLLRVGVAFSFFYAGIAGFIAPQNWVGFFPAFVQNILPAGILLTVWGVLEILLAGSILFLRQTFWPAIIAGVLLVGVTLGNIGSFDVVFRDLSIAASAFALALLSRQTAPTHTIINRIQ